MEILPVLQFIINCILKFSNIPTNNIAHIVMANKVLQLSFKVLCVSNGFDGIGFAFNLILVAAATWWVIHRLSSDIIV